MTEIRRAIIFAFVVAFCGWAFSIYLIVMGDWVPGVVMITALFPVTLMFWMRAREDWDS